MQRILWTVEAVNARVSAEYGLEGFQNHVEKILRYVREHHRFRQWPAIADFAKAAEQCAAKSSETITSFERLSDDERAASRILGKEAVAITYVKGTGAARLLDAGLVKQADLEPYIREYEFDMADVYGPESARERVDTYDKSARWLVENDANLNRAESRKPGDFS